MNKKHSLGARLVGSFLRLNGRLPLSYHRFQARILAWILDHVIRYRRDVIMINLSRSFPDKSYEEIQAIRKRVYLHFASIFTEAIWFGACCGEKGRKRISDSHIVEMTNPEELNRLFNNAHQLMILEAHTGNWEMYTGLWSFAYKEELVIKPADLSVGYMPLSSKLWDEVIFANRTAPVRDQFFNGLVESNHVLRFALANKDRKMMFTFITDQYPYTDGRHPQIEFMHQQTAIMTAATSLACKMDMSVAYMRYRYREDGKGYTMTFIPICEHAKGEDPLQLMQQYYKLLQEDLEAQPWNYLWTHKRWKKR